MQLLYKIFDKISQVKVKSITDSLFKYGLFTLVLGVISAIFTDKDWVTISIFGFSGLFILPAIIAYLYLVVKNPEYLRSENYQLKSQELELLSDSDILKNKEIVISNKNKENKELPFESNEK